MLGFTCPGWANSSECYSGVDPPDSRSCCWSFKADTSTDETGPAQPTITPSYHCSIFIFGIELRLRRSTFGPDGHFYGLHLAYDKLANNEDEKLRVARLLCNAAAYIVDHGFIYVDPLTGNRTSWGYWSPSILNAVGNLGKPNERGLNSLEILSYLSVAHKVCNAHPNANPALAHPAHGTYGMALASLVLDHGYGENLLNVHLTNPGYDDQGIAWFDFGNSFYTYYSFHAAAPWGKEASKFPFPPALTQEALLALKKQFLIGFEAFWAARSYSASAERDGLWSEIYHTITGKPGIADPLWVVRRGPNELIDWNTQNSQRKCARTRARAVALVAVRSVDPSST